MQAGSLRYNLLKISQNNMGWEFCMRVTTPDGAVIPFVQRAE